MSTCCRLFPFNCNLRFTFTASSELPLNKLEGLSFEKGTEYKISALKSSSSDVSVIDDEGASGQGPGYLIPVAKKGSRNRRISRAIGTLLAEEVNGQLTVEGN